MALRKRTVFLAPVANLMFALLLLVAAIVAAVFLDSPYNSLHASPLPIRTLTALTAPPAALHALKVAFGNEAGCRGGVPHFARGFAEGAPVEHAD